jgi:hypothetical protein
VTNPCVRLTFEGIQPCVSSPPSPGCLLIEGVSHEPQSDKDGFSGQHQKQQNRRDHLAAPPTDLPHPALATPVLIHHPGHKRPPFQEQALRTVHVHRPKALGKTRSFRTGLEVETHFSRKCSRSHIVCAAERRQEVIKRILVGDIHACQAQTPFVLFPLEQIVIADSGVE